MKTNGLQPVLLTFLMGLGCLIISSCKSDKESLAGKWKIISMYSERGNEIKETDSLNYYEFNRDGTYMNRFENTNYGGSWTLDEKNKTIGFEQGSVNLNGIYKLTKTFLPLN